MQPHYPGYCRTREYPARPYVPANHRRARWRETVRIANLRDITRGHPSELQTEIGAIVRRVQAVGVELPRRALLYACLLPQERLARRNSVSRQLGARPHAAGGWAGEKGAGP